MIQAWRLGDRGGNASVGAKRCLAALTVLAFVGVGSRSASAADDSMRSVIIEDPSWAPDGGTFDGIVGIDSATTVTDGAAVDTAAQPMSDPAHSTGWVSTIPAASFVSGAEFADCDPVGLFQRLHALHEQSGSCLIGQVDGLVLWRSAPSARPILESGAFPTTPVLDADQLQSTATGGVRASLLRLDGCCGNGWELAYLYAGDFTAQRNLPYQNGPAYALSPPGIYGNVDSQPFDSGNATLLAQLQTAEINRHLAVGPNFRWLAGFRWLRWQERFTLQDTLSTETGQIDDLYQTNCLNDLYGGQIGANARLFSLAALRVDSVVKAGAYYNEASQTSSYTTTDPTNTGVATVTVTQSPASCSFVGEVGLTGVMPITANLDFRFGYLGLFLTGLAQPTQQLSGQQLTPGLPETGSLTATGSVIVQGVTLGLEGRW